jgi:hypothetical protein
MRIVDSDTHDAQEAPLNQAQNRDGLREKLTPTAGQKGEKTAALQPALIQSASQGAGFKQQNTSHTATRLDLDASDDSEMEEHHAERPIAASSGTVDQEPQTSTDPSARSLVDKTQLSAASRAVHPQTGSTEQSVESSGYSHPANGSNPPALVVDTSSLEGNTPEASPSPELVQSVGDVARDGSSASNGKEGSWDDIKLRAFFDESDHIRDLLAVIYDKTSVEPAGIDHAVVGGLFREQNAKLAEITTVSRRLQLKINRRVVLTWMNCSNWTICSEIGSPESSVFAAQSNLCKSI